jgi:hypothetical protein
MAAHVAVSSRREQLLGVCVLQQTTLIAPATVSLFLHQAPISVFVCVHLLRERALLLHFRVVCIVMR